MNNQDSPVNSTLLEFLYTITKYRIFLIVFIVIALSGALTYCLLTPKIYKATASVLPAEESDLLSSLGGISSSISRSFSPLKGLSGMNSSESDKYVAILKSDGIKRDLIEQFNLKKVYDMEKAPYWKVKKALEGNLDYEFASEGNLEINVFDESPQRAADMANYLVQKLNEINTTLHITNAKSTREFVEKRYLRNIQDIDSLENKMKAFQNKYGVIAVPEQIEATIKTMSTLYADLAKEEIELNVLKKTTNEENPSLHNKEVEIQEIKSKLSNISHESEGKDAKVLIPLNNAPEIAGEYFKIYKNLGIQYKIAEFLTPIYEQSKIEEARNTPTVLILDKAFPSDQKAKPKILLFLLIAFSVSLIVGLLLIFTIELLKRLHKMDPIKYAYISNSVKPFKSNKNLIN